LKSSLKQTGRTVIFLALGILMLWVSFKGIDFRDLWLNLKKAEYYWLLPAAAISVLGFFIRAKRWTLLIEPLGYKPGILNAYHSVATGYFANMILPRLGEITKCAALSRKEKIPFDKLVGTMLVERTIDILTTLALFGFTLITGLTSAGSFLSENIFDPAGKNLTASIRSMIIILIIAVVVAALLVILYFVLRKKLRDQPFFRKIYIFGDGITDGLKSIGRLKKKWEFILLTVLLWIAYLFMSFFPLLCLKSTSVLGLSGALFVLVVGSFGLAAPVQSGLGAYHWIVSRGLLVAYGIPLEEGLAYATLSHESQMLLITICGVISLYALFGKRGRKLLSSVVVDISA
jgi:uncharacterized membrane protein YbhN (UPF0104 family)